MGEGREGGREGITITAAYTRSLSLNQTSSEIRYN
jgi:hypothetical protein